MEEKTFHNARFLIVDDELANVRVLENMLEQWDCRDVHATQNSFEVLPLYTSLKPDIILLDLMMPGLDGFGVMEQLKPIIPEGSYVPILVLTADTTTQTKRRALAAGAKDFLTKPFDATELFLRIWNLLETRFLHLQLQEQNQTLERRVASRTADLEKAQVEILDRLARASEWRDDDTGQHTRRVAMMVGLLAEKMGLAPAQTEVLRRAAPLHDVGKIGIPDAILLKPARLAPEEFAVMRDHTSIGALLLAGGQSELVQTAQVIAQTHHERWDGQGYPEGLSGEDIPLEGRILAVVDVFDALTHERPYKKAWPVEEALAEIKTQRGHHFDPRIVDAFFANLDDILAIQELV